jgi:hypothetical protein
VLRAESFGPTTGLNKTRVGWVLRVVVRRHHHWRFRSSEAAPKFELRRHFESHPAGVYFDIIIEADCRDETRSCAILHVPQLRTKEIDNVDYPNFGNRDNLPVWDSCLFWRGSTNEYPKKRGG